MQRAKLQQEGNTLLHNPCTSLDSLPSMLNAKKAVNFLKLKSRQLSYASLYSQLQRLRMQLLQQGITLPDNPRTSHDMHLGVPDVPNQVNTSGNSVASLPVSHISPR